MSSHTASAPNANCHACNFRREGLCAKLEQENVVRKLDGARRVQSFRAGDVLYQAGAPLTHVSLLHDGWAVSCHLLPDGRRQVLELLLPGDMFSSLALHQTRLPFSVVALTSVRTCAFDAGRLRTHRQRMLDLIHETGAREIGSLQRRVVDLGRRRGEQRLAALLVDLTVRLERRGEVRDGWLPLRLRQYDMADMLGMTQVHVSRLLARFRRSGWVQTRPGAFRLRDRGALETLAWRDGAD